MVAIRLSRSGAKKRPFYQIVVADQRRKRGGRYIERIGFFNPMATGGEVRLRLDLARVEYWIERGAQPSERVSRLIRDPDAGVLPVEAPGQPAAATDAEAQALSGEEAAPGADQATNETAPETEAQGSPAP